MPSHLWPPDVPFQRLVLSPENPCQHCAGDLRICDHRHRDIQVFGGRLHLVCRLGQCKKDLCPMRHRTVSPESEMGIAPPRLLVGWEPFAWIGHRRLAKDWRVAQIRDELHDSYQVELSVDSIEHYIARYQAMLAAQAQDPLLLAEAYRDSAGVILSIDGLQPEKGHETLYVVRELTCKRVWFAVPLISSAAPEVARLLVQAKEWAHRLDKPVLAWVSDKQDAFVTGIAELFPDVPHRYCANHFLRDAARPMLDVDCHAKVQMRRKVRGLREIERATLTTLRGETSEEPEHPEAPTGSLAPPAMPSTTQVAPPGASLVLDYCSAVRGVLNDDQGGPIHPPGVRMAEALQEIRASLARIIAAPRLDHDQTPFKRLAACIDRGLHCVAEALANVREYAVKMAEVAACLDPANGEAEDRLALFENLARTFHNATDPVIVHMGKTMASFLPGLFVGAEIPGIPFDNLDLERAFRRPKGHQRHLHGHAHTGSKLVEEGPTLLPALDVHQRHPDLFKPEELAPHYLAQPPPCQKDAVHRRTIMRKARSPKQRPVLLASLEARFFEAC